MNGQGNGYTNELTAIIAAARNAAQLRQTAVLATVVDTSGSSYRQPGARMLVTDEGWQAGSVSGGCLEGDIVRRGAWLTTGGSIVLTYDTTDDDDMIHGLGLGCRGVIRVLIERLQQEDRADLIGFLQACIASRSQAVVVTVIDAQDEDLVGRRLLLAAAQNLQPIVEHDFGKERTGDAENDAHNSILQVLRSAAHAALRQKQSATRSFDTAAGKLQAFVEFIPPAPSLVVFGAGHDAIALVKFAKTLGFYVTVVDRRPAYAKAARFPQADRVVLCVPDAAADSVPLTRDTFALVMTHHYLSDRSILRMLFESDAPYIGMLGPKNRTRELLSDIDDAGFSINDAHLQRLHAPVGLDIGAACTEQVALSILAEIQAVLAGRHGGHLRERNGPIHVDTLRANPLTAQAVSRPTPQPASFGAECPSLS